MPTKSEAEMTMALFILIYQRLSNFATISPSS
jgi:hypothetical protein